MPTAIPLANSTAPAKFSQNARTRRSRTPLALVATTVMIGVLMGVMDSAIVNVALPTISGNLGASTDEVAWVATGYVLGMMIIMPLNGWLTARFGRKRYYLAAFGLFTAASFLCGTATSVYVLILWRIVQGLGGGALQPIAQAILFESVPPQRRGEMMAIFSLGAVVGPAIGPVLGGYIIDNANWQMLFYFKIPLCLIGLAMAYFVLDDGPSEERTAHDISWLGFSAMAIGLTSLQFVLSRGQREDWFDSKTIVLATICTVVTLAYFIVQQSRAKHPFVNLEIFKSVPFAVGCIITVVSGFGLYGINLVTPLFFQGPLRLSAYDAGIYLLQGSLATALSVIVVGELTKRFDARGIIAVGLLLFAIGAWWMGGLTGDAGYWDVFWPRVLQGWGLGLLFVPLIVATLAGISLKNMSDATGIATLVRYLGGNIGIAVLEVVQVRRADFAWETMAGSLTLHNPQVAHLVDALGLRHAALALTSMVANNAEMMSYLYVFRVSAIMFVLCIPLLLLMPKQA